MPTISLPDDPSLDHLRGQARSLQRTANAGDPVARQRILTLRPDHDGEVRLSLAQLVLAREYGSPAGRGCATTSTSSPGTAATRSRTVTTRLPAGLSQLHQRQSGPVGRRPRAARAGPAADRDQHLGGGGPSDPEAVAGFLAADRTLARAEGGPYRLTALAYLAYSRLDPDVRVEPVLDTARILLRAGATRTPATSGTGCRRRSPC